MEVVDWAFAAVVAVWKAAVQGVETVNLFR